MMKWMEARMNLWVEIAIFDFGVPLSGYYDYYHRTSQYSTNDNP